MKWRRDVKPFGRNVQPRTAADVLRAGDRPRSDIDHHAFRQQRESLMAVSFDGLDLATKSEFNDRQLVNQRRRFQRRNEQFHHHPFAGGKFILPSVASVVAAGVVSSEKSKSRTTYGPALEKRLKKRKLQRNPSLMQSSGLWQTPLPPPIRRSMRSGIRCESSACR